MSRHLIQASRPYYNDGMHEDSDRREGRRKVGFAREVKEGFRRLVVVAYFTWFISSAAFFGYINGWDARTALFYVVEIGLSVGFSVVTSTSTISRVAITIHVFVVAVLESAVVVLSCGHLIKDIERKMYRRLNWSNLIPPGSSLLLLLLTTAFIWGWLVEELDVVHAWLFALTTASGAGLIEPRHASLFVAVYCAISIPTWHYVVGNTMIIIYHHLTRRGSVRKTFKYEV